MKYKIGQSTDIHQLDDNLDLIIGGVKIDHYKGIIAHSDGDILVHAITEAIIGALGLGDLGDFFNDNDPLNENRSSMEMLKEINELMISKNYHINNIDSLIIIEKPKMVTHKDEMKKNIANTLGINNDQINIKATRGEKLGFVGKEKGVIAQAIVLLEKNE